MEGGGNKKEMEGVGRKRWRKEVDNGKEVAMWLRVCWPDRGPMWFSGILPIVGLPLYLSNHEEMTIDHHATKILICM